jgi:alpha-D-xyloside xylohydrolase
VSRVSVAFCLASLILASSVAAQAQQEGKLVLDRGGSTIVIEPYADNIVRVTLSLQKANALSPPG